MRLVQQKPLPSAVPGSAEPGLTIAAPRPVPPKARPRGRLNPRRFWPCSARGPRGMLRRSPEAGGSGALSKMLLQQF